MGRFTRALIYILALSAQLCILTAMDTRPSVAAAIAKQPIQLAQSQLVTYCRNLAAQEHAAVINFNSTCARSLTPTEYNQCEMRKRVIEDEVRRYKSQCMR
jgi:hypothetical protein